LPSLPRLKLLGFSFGKSLQSFREGKLISLTEIMKPHDKLNLLLLQNQRVCDEQKITEIATISAFELMKKP
jgi:hypothetical protein